MTDTALNSSRETRTVSEPREIGLDRRDADRMIAPAAGLAWIAMALAAHFWPQHFGAGAAFATEFSIVFSVVGVLLLIGAAAPKAIADKVTRLAPWFLFAVLAAEVWLIGPAAHKF